ncbi:hypothetical protein AKO1_006994 [Acrasis kona]|uniref:Uncharacterized protein n=1 Tax=Acrasis kona TaxID=1008807 RepID=A0AAW2YUM6_9EUKA
MDFQHTSGKNTVIPPGRSQHTENLYATAIIGDWEGEQNGGVGIEASFYRDGVVIFLKESGVYEVMHHHYQPTLKMTFQKNDTGPTFTTYNAFCITSDGRLLIDTDKNPLVLVRKTFQTIQQQQQQEQQQQQQQQQVTQQQWPNSQPKLAPTQRQVSSSENVLRKNVVAMTEYHNETWGLHFSTPEPWFFIVNDNIPSIYSTSEPGIMFVRFHRPYTDFIRHHKYRQGYREGNIRLDPTFQDMVDMPDTLCTEKNRLKLSYGDYKDQNNTMFARAVTVISTFGDCMVVMGVCAADEKKFEGLAKAMNVIANNAYFTTPAIVSAYDSLQGTYVNYKKDVLRLDPNLTFQWSYGGKEAQEQDGGVWDRAGNANEGDLVFNYRSGKMKSSRFICFNNGVMNIDNVPFQKI